MCELVNVVGGGVKRELAKAGVNVMIGLPVAVEGKIQIPDGELKTLRFRIGDRAFSMLLCKGS